MTSDPDDAELIVRSLDGDEDAFVEVVRRHEAAVGAYLEEARAVLRTAMTIEEVETKTAPRRRAGWGAARAGGFGVAARGAAAGAVAVVVMPASAPSHNAAASGKPSVKAAPAAVNPVLAQLAADVKVLPVEEPGNATLEVRNQ